MHIPNQKCRISKYVDVDMANEPIYEASIVESCSVVTYKLESMNTPVRADTSASQGRSTMQRANLRVIFLPNTRATFGSKFELINQPNRFFKVVDIQPRFDALGSLDQYEADLELL